MEETLEEKLARQAREEELKAQVEAAGPAGDGIYRGQKGFKQWTVSAPTVCFSGLLTRTKISSSRIPVKKM